MNFQMQSLSHQNLAFAHWTVNLGCDLDLTYHGLGDAPRMVLRKLYIYNINVEHEVSIRNFKELNIFY